MSYDEIKLDYELAEAMAKTFKQSAEQVEATIGEMKNIAATLESGALLGQGGESFAEALNTKLGPSLSRLMAKFIELEADVQSAISSMREADESSKGMFN
jgi:WXG100 family type VII secretion target